MLRQRHSNDEVTAGNEELKAKHSTALLTVENPSSIYSMMDLDDEKETAEGSDWVLSVENTWEDDGKIAYFSFDEKTDIEQVFSLNTFLHCRSIQPANKKAHHTPRSHPGTQQKSRFDGLKNYTCPNRTSFITFEQYRTYSQTLNLPQSMKAVANLSMSGNGEIRKAVSAVAIQVPPK